MPYVIYGSNVTEIGGSEIRPRVSDVCCCARGSFDHCSSAFSWSYPSPYHWFDSSHQRRCTAQSVFDRDGMRWKFESREGRRSDPLTTEMNFGIDAGREGGEEETLGITDARREIKRRLAKARGEVIRDEAKEVAPTVVDLDANFSNDNLCNARNCNNNNRNANNDNDRRAKKTKDVLKARKASHKGAAEKGARVLRKSGAEKKTLAPQRCDSLEAMTNGRSNKKNLKDLDLKDWSPFDRLNYNNNNSVNRNLNEDAKDKETDDKKEESSGPSGPTEKKEIALGPSESTNTLGEASSLPEIELDPKEKYRHEFARYFKIVRSTVPMGGPTLYLEIERAATYEE